MSQERQLQNVANQDERWVEVVMGVAVNDWDFDTQVEYWGTRIADAVILGRTDLERVSEQLRFFSLLHHEASLVYDAVDGEVGELNENDEAEIWCRWVAYRCFRDGKNRVRTETHRERHLAHYQARVAMLHSDANIGLGRLEARDLNLDDLWYDKE